MKKLLLLLLAMVGVLAVACEPGGDVEEENGGTPFVPEITYSPKTLEFKSVGGEKEVLIVANFEYQVIETADWLSFEKTETGITVFAEGNEDTQKRETNIVISNQQYGITKVVEVLQEAYVPKIELMRETIDVEFEPDTYTVEVTSPYFWEAESKNEWLKVVTKTGIAGTKTLKFSVERNEEEEVREGTIVVKNEDYNLVAELYVVQKAFVSTITIEPETLNFAVEGGEQTVAITANFEYEVTTDADWVKCAKMDNGITVTVPNYVEIEERTAEITISNEKYGVSEVVKVTQGAFVPEWSVSPESLAFAVEGGTREVAITANFEYEYSTNVDWLTIEKSEKGVNIAATPNTKFEERTAEITISSEKYGVSKTITITQQGVSAESKNVILYTSSDGEIVTPYAFGANIVSNTYENGQGVIIFDAPVTSIGDWAFYYCTSLTSVTIPDSVTSIGDRAFLYCISLTSVTIPDSVTSIGGSAFQNCASLTNVTIGNSVTSIEDYAFRNCTSLTSITIGNSVTSIGNYAFYECTSLTDTYVNITDLAAYAKSNNTHRFPGNKHLLVNGTEITELVIPDSVTSIGNYAFYECKSLTSVTIGNSVTSIGDYAFEYCSSLTSVTIGNSVTSIGDDAFSVCTSLTSITIPDSVTSIGEYAFRNCSSLTSVTIPDSVTSIGGSVFSGCTSLTSVTIGNSVTSIGFLAFGYCTSLTSVTIPDSVTGIGGWAFQDCTSLTSVTIPDSVTSIVDYAFYNCTSLKEVYCKPTTPPTGGSSMFSSNASGRKIYVPRNSVSAYKAAEYWKDYASSIVGYDF